MQRKENTKNKRFKGRKMKQTEDAKIENDRDGKCNKWKVQGKIQETIHSWNVKGHG